MQAVFIAQANGLEDACGDDPSLLCELIYEWSGSSTTAEIFDAIGRPLTALFILLAAWLINRIVRRLIDRSIRRLIEVREQRALEDAARAVDATDETRPELAERALDRARRLAEASDRSRQRTDTLGAILRNLAAIVIYTIAVLMALAEFDVSLGPLIASAGIVGIALGFGAQSLVKDFLSGIFMLIEDQYGVGDVIDVGDAAGTVEVVSLRTTQIRDVHGTLWHVPNGAISRVANKSQAWARTVLDIEVAYDTDLAHAMRIIKEVADSVWNEMPENATILEEPEVWGVENFSENSVVIRLAMKVEPAEQWATARLVRGRLKEAFDDEGIEIPFPQRTIWINQVSDAEPAAPRRSGRPHAHEDIVSKKQPDEELEV